MFKVGFIALAIGFASLAEATVPEWGQVSLYGHDSDIYFTSNLSNLPSAAVSIGLAIHHAHLAWCAQRSTTTTSNVCLEPPLLLAAEA